MKFTNARYATTEEDLIKQFGLKVVKESVETESNDVNQAYEQAKVIMNEFEEYCRKNNVFSKDMFRNVINLITSNNRKYSGEQYDYEYGDYYYDHKPGSLISPNELRLTEYDSSDNEENNQKIKYYNTLVKCLRDYIDKDGFNQEVDPKKYIW